MQAVKYKVRNMKGKEVGELQLDGEIFDCEVNEALVHETVVWQLAKRRAGTHSTLTKGDIGEKGKPWKQKGTGRARAGSNVSPLWVGGGVAHGPKPRDYTTRLSKRTRRQALCSVLTEKVRSNLLVVVDSLEVASGKTKDMSKALVALGVEQSVRAIIMVPKEKDDKTTLSARNLAGILPIGVDGLNVYDLLKHRYLIATPDMIESLQKRIKKESSEAKAKKV